MPANYILLERIELNASAASVTFSNIPQSGYTDLKLFVSTRTDTITGAWDNVYITFNGSSSGYSQRILYGDGSIAQSDTGSSTYIRTVYSNTATQGSNYFSSNEICIPNYTSSNYKTASMESAVEQNGTNGHLSIASALWTNTSAITSITLAPSAYTFAAGCTFSLYGIAATGTTPTVAPKATGGNITTDGTYWIHTFNSTGIFTPAITLSCDALVVAGGGGAGCGLGYGSGGGGGAGGFRTGTNLSVSNQAYTVTVGAGGAGGGTNTAAPGTTGTNSVFSSITSSGGGGGGPLMSGAAFGDGKAGGSGGGSGTAGSGGAGNAGGYSPVEGYAGGSWATVGSHGSGGGGASQAGSSETSSAGGAGGNGTANSYSGSSVTYAGGGGGGASGSGTSGGAGGSGGGGRGANGASDNGVAGTANTGGGGGGARVGTAAAGGSGVVIIRYTIA